MLNQAVNNIWHYISQSRRDLLNDLKSVLRLSILFCTALYSQSIVLPLDHAFENRLGLLVDSDSSTVHTSSRPLEFSKLHFTGEYDSLFLIQREYNYSGDSWLERIIFSEHLFETSNEEYKLSLDFLPDIGIGTEVNTGERSWVNVRGIQFDGMIGNSFSMRMQYFESLAKFPSYISDFIKKNHVIPGQGYKRIDGPDVYDYSHASGSFVYAPSKYLTFQAGHDKNFIGDGYRSMLLSDVGFNYPFLKLTGYVWDLQYVIMWAQFQDITSSPILNDRSWFNKKYGVFHYLDWNINSRLSVGLFESVIWRNYDSTNGYRGFELQYLNPFILFRPVDYSMGSPDNALLGMNLKYKVFEKTVLYAQVIIDEMKFKEYFDNKGWWGNKYGYQFGIKSYSVFGVQHLSLQGEVNSATPYTYSHQSSATNYGHYNQSLAHPLGANFYETLVIGNYTLGRFEFRAQINYARYGSDTVGVNYGGDIFKSYESRTNEYENYVAQGLQTDLYYADMRVSYVLNPKTDLRVELGGMYRLRQSDLGSEKSLGLNVGIRSAMRNMYFDF